jgi:ribosomal protein S6--L-glutamate ligase
MSQREVVLKAARGSLGKGVWRATTCELPALSAELPPGPYMIMDYVEHHGDDLKIFVAGSWHAAIERPFPATTLEQKRGRPVAAPAEALEVTHAVGRLLGLRCFGCDFVRGADGWMLVDVNAFPGYKGAAGAAEAIVDEIARVVREEMP